MFFVALTLSRFNQHGLIISQAFTHLYFRRYKDLLSKRFTRFRFVSKRSSITSWLLQTFTMQLRHDTLMVSTSLSVFIACFLCKPSSEEMSCRVMGLALIDLPQILVFLCLGYWRHKRLDLCIFLTCNIKNTLRFLKMKVIIHRRFYFRFLMENFLPNHTRLCTLDSWVRNMCFI